MGCVQSCCYGTLYFTQEFYQSYIRGHKNVQLFLAIVGGMIFMVILLAIFGAFRHHCEDPEIETYYSLMTLSWPQTLCKKTTAKQCEPTIPLNFTLHGLWPVLRGRKTQLINCLKDGNEYIFSLDKLESIQPQLQQEWPNIFLNSSNSNFWQHEWTKHGLCTDMTVQDYFEKSLKLKQKYPIYKWLNDGKIKPNNSKAYTEKEFQDVLNKHDLSPDYYVMTCVEVSNDYNVIKQRWLDEIRLCAQFHDPMNDNGNLVKCDKDSMYAFDNKSFCNNTEGFYFVEYYKDGDFNI